MKIVFLLLIITSCSSLNSIKNKYSLELAESIKMGSSNQVVENIVGKPHKIVDLSKYTKNSKLIGQYYYNTENKSQFNLAVFLDPSSKRVKKVTWTPGISEKK